MVKPRRFAMPSCLLVSLLFAGVAVAADESDASVEKAVEAAESWLELIDDGEYVKSWEESAALFKGAVTKDQWEAALNASRKPLGDLVSHQVKSTQYATSLPGAPDGEYVVIQFASSFSNKESAVETVTPMKDPDGIWRVSGYYIK